MRIPLTRLGLPQVAIYPLGIAVLMAVFPFILPGSLSGGAIWAIEGALGIVLVWALSFFRDPRRCCPSDEDLLLAPADGRITDLEVVQDDEFLHRKVMRIGIFLSIFNVHINRMPCVVQVKKTEYRPGCYKNALDPESSRVNESNAIFLERRALPRDSLIVRQISGAIARRIVCEAGDGQDFDAGDRFGMIKFGSRTELYVPFRDNLTCVVKVGDKVKAGLTPLARYEQ